MLTLSETHHIGGQVVSVYVSLSILIGRFLHFQEFCNYFRLPIVFDLFLCALSPILSLCMTFCLSVLNLDGTFLLWVIFFFSVLLLFSLNWQFMSSRAFLNTKAIKNVFHHYCGNQMLIWFIHSFIHWDPTARCWKHFTVACADKIPLMCS